MSSDSEVQTTKPETKPEAKPEVKKGFLESLGDAAKLTVFAAFIMYAVGFVIWTSYLGKYGFAPMGMLQVEYISAAFCFLLLFIYLALPSVWLVLAHLEKTKEVAKRIGEPFGVLSVMWTFCLPVLITMYYSGSSKLDSALKYWFVLLIMGLVHFMLYYHFIGKNAATLKDGEQPLLKRIRVLKSPVWPVVYSLVCIVIVYTHLPNADATYFLVTPIIFLMFTSSYIELIQKGLNKRFVIFNVTVGIFAFAGLVTDVELFGMRQFEHIPKYIGGGKPQKALLRLSANNQELAELLQLKHCSLDPTNVIKATNGFYGPVQILIKTEKEIYFTIDEASSTNKHTARQIRSDLVEGMVFLNTP
jgi:hypothetical protein